MSATREVLIVDDEREVRDVIGRALTRKGISTVSEAADVQSALAQVDSSPPALIITDLRMPGQDGLWLLKELRGRYPDIPVIVLTGADDAETAVRCLKEGAEDYLTKPIHFEELFIAVSRALEKARLLRENREFEGRLETMLQDRTKRLRRALEEVEDSYQTTLAALVSSRPAGAGGLGRGKGSIADGRPGPLEPNDREDVGDGEEYHVELTILRSVGELIGDAASPADVGNALASALVERGVAAFARLWLDPKEGSGLHLIVSKGEEGETREVLVELAASSGSTQWERRADGGAVNVPIGSRGKIVGVLQIGWRGAERTSLGRLAERLALFLGASLTREHDAADARKTERQLELLHELASASRYTLDFEHVAHFLMSSLHKIVDYENAGLLLLDEPPTLRIQTCFAADEALVSRVRGHILNTLRLTCGVEVGNELEILVSQIDRPPRAAETFDKPRSFVNVPLTVGGSVAGLIHVSSGREAAFSEDDILFLNRVASFIASSVQGVRELLEAMKGRIEMMVEHMTDGVLMLDGRGAPVAMNKAARTILRIDAEVERTEGRLAARQVVTALELDPIGLVRAERRSIKRVIDVGGVPYQAQISPIDDGRGGLGAVVAFRNFSEEKKIDAMKSEFINIVSHELRTPLTAVKNCLQLLGGSRLGELNEQQRRFSTLALGNVEQLIGMINDLLDLSKIEAGKVHIALRPTRLNESVERVVASLRPQAEQKGIGLEIGLGDDLPVVYADAASVERVLVNLMGNALKFTESGGTIGLEAKSVLEERHGSERCAVRIVVSDTGKGIPEDQLESIFEKFHQVDATENRGVVGTGLGLSICRELVEAHHGRIWVESELERGSRFVLVIPVLTEEEVFLKSLDRDVARARRLPAQLALASIAMRNHEEVKVCLGDEAYQSLLDAVDAAAQGVTRRSTDRVELRREDAQLMAVLIDTPREGSDAFARRLVEHLTKATERFGVRLELAVATAVFPDEAATAERLYRRVTERAMESQPMPTGLEPEAAGTVTTTRGAER